MKWQWTYGPTLLLLNVHSHTSDAFYNLLEPRQIKIKDRFLIWNTANWECLPSRFSQTNVRKPFNIFKQYVLEECLYVMSLSRQVRGSSRVFISFKRAEP